MCTVLPSMTYREVQRLVDEGYFLSKQDFARQALIEKLERWKAEHTLGQPLTLGEKKGR